MMRSFIGKEIFIFKNLDNSAAENRSAGFLDDSRLCYTKGPKEVFA